MKNIKNAYHKNFRILKFLHNVDRNVLPLIISSAIVEAIYPYINFVFMAFIIDSLLLQQWQEAIIYVAIMIIIQCVIGIINDVLSAKFESSTMSTNRKCVQKLCDYNLRMDYNRLEDKESREELEKAEFCAANTGGFGMLMQVNKDILKAVISILISIVFIITLCFETGSTLNHSLTFIMTPIGSLCLIVGLLMLMFAAYARVAKKANNNIIQNFNDQLEISQEQRYLQEQVFMDYTKAKEIRLYQMQNLLLQLNVDRLKILLSFTKKDLHLNSKIKLNGTILNDGLNILVYLFVALKVYTNAITIGFFVHYVNSFQQMNISLQLFIEKTNIIMRLNTYLTYFLDFIEQDNKLFTGSLPIEKRNDNIYEIEFHNVSFQYPNTEIYVLDDISLKLKLKDKLACVGKNGAGKTTFIKLLCRLYEPTKGYITLNGIDIRKYDYLEYLRLFSVVFQDFALFAFPLNENISCSMEGDTQKIWSCLDKAGVKEKVEQMSKQLETMLFKYYEEEGEEVSGGEAQKLAIARALYKDAPFVVLDEPTAALDPISEYEMYSHFNELVNNKTSIFISHRMSSCRFCDDIIVFDKGKVIQRGNHHELMKDKTSTYAILWNAQAKYYV